MSLASVVRDTSGVRLIHCSADPDHNRMVLAYTGAPEDVLRATKRLATEVFARIDLGGHEGQHPRIGALDVVPFVTHDPAGTPAHEAALETCRAFGEWVGATGVPVFYYEDAATSPHRRPLPEVRRGGFEGLEQKMSTPEWRPDQGPSSPHRTAGAVITGVRRPLVRFNVNLDDPDPSVAREIASAIRESSGGLTAVRALGLALANRGMSQITMNLTDYRTTSLATVYRMVTSLARTHGMEIAGTEIIGPIPRPALSGLGPDILETLDSTQVLDDI